MDGPWWTLVAALVLITVGSLLAGYVQSAGAGATIHYERFYGSYDAAYSAYLWVPNGVDQNHPAPAILATHGYNNSKEYMSNTALELARRGYVVLDMDMDGHGGSDESTATVSPSFFSPNGIGTVDGLRFLRSLPIVDRNNIGLIGMSMGGVAIDAAAQVLPNDYKSMFFMDSACVSGCATDKNMAISMGKESELPTFPLGAPTAASDISWPAFMKIFGTDKPIVPGKVYGSIADGTARIFYYHFGDHAISTDDPTSIGDAVTWFGMTLQGAKTTIPSSNQIWPFKDLGTGMAFLGFAFLLFALGALLLRNRVFASLNEEVPEYKGNTGTRWWVFAAFTTLLGPVLFDWAFNVAFGHNFFTLEAVTTGFAFWLLLQGIVTIIVLVAGYYVWGRPAGATGVNYGLTWSGIGLDWGKILRSLLLAVVILAIGYYILWLATAWLKVDFRFWVLTLKTTDLRHFVLMPAYLIPVGLFFVPFAVALHGTLRPRNGQASLTREMVTNIVVWGLGVAGLLVFYYVPLTWFNGPAGDQGLGMINFIALIALVPLLAGISTYFFRKTGHVYLGSFINTLFIVWYLVAANTTWKL
jgi:hypothetical protein